MNVEHKTKIQKEKENENGKRTGKKEKHGTRHNDKP